MRKANKSHTGQEKCQNKTENWFHMSARVYRDKNKQCSALVPPDHQGQGLLGSLYQTDGLLPGAAEGSCIHAHHLIAGPESDRSRHAALLHLHVKTVVETLT
ncbi:hypothetical protein ILYODFUR_027696 [Ilyodon furcidens]|uniref:Uncharacterized protein n=1 Tax=Ilyodon furcidens TaxID=33524 RepID=A0ABV0VID3_9TELE